MGAFLEKTIFEVLTTIKNIFGIKLLFSMISVF
jgi:hypothetical protein